MAEHHIPPCKEGDRIRLLAMPDDPDPVPVGSTGTVIEQPLRFSDKSWQVMVAWDIPHSLNLCVPPDRFEVIP